MAETRFLLVVSTCPDSESARQIADALVRSHLAACVSVLPKALSVYRWQDSLESAEEHVLLIKTSKERYVEVQQTIRSLHPYELPEVIAVPIVQGLEEYLSWLADCVHER